MAKTRRNRSGLATRRRILKAATAMFSAAGYEATSLRQMASAAEIDLATLKYHFGDKATLYGEVYRLGHATFISHLEPVFAEMGSVRSKDELRENIRMLVGVVHTFMAENPEWVRMVAYRMLEDPSSISVLEDELQGIAIAMIDRAFEALVEQGVMRPIDTRAVIGFLVTAFPMWMVTTEVKGSWFGDPVPLAGDDGRARSEVFFTDLLERYLLERDLQEKK